MTGAIQQKLLRTHYKLLDSPGVEPPSFRDVEFSVFSEFGEDGILLYIFSLIPPYTRKCVEMSAGNGQECNTANLIIHHNWIGLLFDANKEYVRQGVEYYRKNPATKIWPPAFKQAWIDRTNVNSLLIDNGMEGEIDLLSLDMDGVDYWIWESIRAIRPMVVVVEANPCIPLGQAVTVPYNPQFRVDATRNYFGASLEAFVKLARKKNYRLVGANHIGTNAFFVCNLYQHPWLPEVTSTSCLQHPRASYARKKRWPTVKNKAWEKV